MPFIIFKDKNRKDNIKLRKRAIFYIQNCFLFKKITKVATKKLNKLLKVLFFQELSFIT